ncbi:hypothetical protein [Pandoraea sp. NPDC090278]|uniref:hypothetical protein n=1 Tax=Pandoraea sp. NPDC090278 TaxID=3364391 RepID=UPI00383B5102
MAKAAPITTSFDAGELSPRLEGRVDIAKYPNGCYRLENFIPTVQGPAIRRGGFRFVNPIKDSTGRAWLVRFQVSETISYMLEFGGNYIRFYVDRGILVDGTTPVEVVTPYSWADLTDANGMCQIHTVQSADTMYVFHPKYPVQKLLRVTATSFTFEKITFANGPFKDVNTAKGTTVVASSTLGAVTLVASQGIFQAGHVGTLFYLESADLSAAKPWAVYQEVNVGDIRRVDARVYKCVAVGTGSGGNPVTGTSTPIHTQGMAWDGDGVDIDNDQRGPIGVEWLFLHAGYGMVILNTVTDSTHASGNVVSELPSDVATGTGTWKWAHSLFSSVEGWPEHGAFWRERLVLARRRDIAISVSGDFENFSSKIDGEVAADAAIRLTLNAKQINKIVWLVESEQLLVGTDGDEWVVQPIQANQALGPGNVQAVKRTAYGSRLIQPVEASGRVLFIQASGKKLRDYQYDYSSDNFISSDTAKLADHITSTGVVDIAFQQEPYSIIWACRADGVLIGLTYDQEVGRSDVYGWARSPSTNGQVEALETMPSPDGTSDDLWAIIRRRINGVDVRYVEWLEPPLDDDSPQANAFYVDSGLSYRGEPTETISGLSHLEGQNVDVLVDGATHPKRVVVGGTIELQEAGSVVHVGIPAPARVATMRLNAGAADGTAQGKTQRVSDMVIRMHRTLGGKVGTDESNLQELQFRRPSNAMDQAPPLFTGDTDPIELDSDYSGTQRLWYVNDQPLPATLVALMPIVQTSDDR